ncbi:MAG TPA: hypothetical protein VI456_07940 [Polyangia bacterium]
MRRTALLPLLCLALWPHQARADGEAPLRPGGEVPPTPTSPGMVIGIVAVALLVPSEFGASIPTHDADAGTEFVLGWAWQAPVPPSEPASHHRIVAGIDYLPTADGNHVRSRIGYRYDRRHLFAGLAVGVEHQGFLWSPEIGAKLFNLAPASKPFSGSVHLLVRGDVAPRVDALRGVTVLLGWSFI